MFFKEKCFYIVLSAIFFSSVFAGNRSTSNTLKIRYYDQDDVGAIISTASSQIGNSRVWFKNDYGNNSGVIFDVYCQSSNGGEWKKICRLRSQQEFSYYGRLGKCRGDIVR